MNEKRKKEVTIFLATIVTVVATFGMGIAYIKGDASVGGAGSSLLADIAANTVAPIAATSSPIIFSTATSSATDKASSSSLTTKSTTTSGSVSITTTTTKTVNSTSTSSAPTSTEPVAVKSAPTSTAPAPVIVAAPAPKPTPTAPAPVIALALPYNETNFASDTNWHATWGTFTINSSKLLSIEATSKTNGATVLLKNSTAWTNYQFDATFDWIKGESFGLVARYVNSKNYTMCEFNEVDRGDIQVTLEQYVNGQEHNLSQGLVSGYEPAPGALTSAFIRVYDTTGTCSFNGSEISNNNPDSYMIDQPFNGGIGFTMWDPTENNTEMIVKNVSVQPAFN